MITKPFDQSQSWSLTRTWLSWHGLRSLLKGNSTIGFLSAVFLILFSRLGLAQSVDQSLTIEQIQETIQMAHLSTAVYDLSKKQLEGGWELQDFRDDPDGFRAALYERTLGNGKIERTIAFAGTRDIRDIATDISQGNPVPMGVWDTVFTEGKFKRAMDFAKQYTEAKDRSTNTSISFTGQSLGGTYAQLCSLYYGEKATVFNSAAVVKADSMLASGMRQNAPNLITQFVLDGDFVHDPTHALPSAQQYGKEYRVQLPADLKVSLLPSLFLDHGMEAFQVALEGAYAAKLGKNVSTQPLLQPKDVAAFRSADIYQVYELPRKGAEVLSQQLFTMADGLQSMKLLALNNDKLQTIMKDPAFKKAFGPAPTWLGEAGERSQQLYGVYDAWQSDMHEMHGWQGVADNPWVLIRSRTLEQFAQIGLEQGLLPRFYEILDHHQLIPYQTQLFLDGTEAKLGTPTFGVVDLVRAVGSNAGRGYADIDTVTKYMDALVGLTWGATGLAVSGGNLRVAEVFQNFGQATANSARWALQASGAQDALSQQRSREAGQPGQLLDMYRVLQERNAAEGKPIQSILEFFSPKGASDFSQARDLLKANGFTESDIQQKAGQIQAELQVKSSQFASNPLKSISVPTDGTSFGRMAQNAQFAADLASASHKVVIFGSGPLAEAAFQRASTRLGSENVKLVSDIKDTFERNSIASDFGAETTIRITQEHYREVTQNGYRQRFDDLAVQPPASRNPPLPLATAPDSIGSDLRYRSPRVGGVMLQGTAEMGNTDSPMTGGNFSLIFQGTNGEIDVPTLRRFVTALWATYFTSNGPGISIDPIGSFTDRHAVRYIGRVINSDLGRVMRETDYQMKSWAVGTSRPDILNWSTPEEIGIRNGTVHVGAPSRFWFVPEKMQFSKADNALLFDSGIMRVKTEYLFSGKGEKNPENEEWAEQFTSRYNEIAQRYPIYDELFEYAKLVSLAKYLKERRVPLLWFLLANREMVLTEDSPATVKAFAKKSDYIEEIQIAGGVDLSASLSGDSYVADAELLKALADARRNSPSPEATESPNPPPPIGIVQRANESLTVTPSQSVVISDSRSPEDAFATDLGVRLDGSPNLEIARYRRTDFAQVGTFGRDWHLMIPYAIKPGSDARRSFAGAVVPETMTLQNLLTGREESLHFDTDRYGIAGYIPEHPETALNIGLFFLSNRTFRLVDKLGCEFQFDEAGRLTDMSLAPNYQVRYEYAQKKINWRNFDPLPFRLVPEGTDRVPVQNVTVPKQLRLFDSATGKEEVFAFDAGNSSKKVRYVPLNLDLSENSFISLMTDGSFVLKRKSGGEIAFDAGGQFTYMVVDILEKMIQKPYEVRFEYDVFQGQYRMVAARVFDQKTDKVLHEVAYEYSPSGNLAGALVASAE